MPRAVMIAFGLGAIALVVMGTRSTSSDDEGSATAGGTLRVLEAPDREANDEPEISFTLPEGATAEQDRLGLDLTPASVAVERNGTVGGFQLDGIDPITPLLDDGSPPLSAEEAAEQFRFPKRGVWDAFSRRLTSVLNSGSLERLVTLEPEVRAALDALRAIPGHVEYADWLEDRLQDIEVAQRAAERDRALAETDEAAVPLYDVWLERMRERPPPARARLFVPTLKPIFAEARLPPALVWLAETESSFNPNARSPAGARGLYQLMPRTARELGLRLRPYDQRLDPVKNAQSAARYLAQLQEQFRDWPLVLAAYHSGPTRVSRLMASRSATTFGEIADALPVETQLYVPRVLATLAVREGVTPNVLALTSRGLTFADQESLAAE